jgi:hypothetical protein
MEVETNFRRPTLRLPLLDLAFVHPSPQAIQYEDIYTFGSFAVQCAMSKRNNSLQTSFSLATQWKTRVSVQLYASVSM